MVISTSDQSGAKPGDVIDQNAPSMVVGGMGLTSGWF